MGGRLTVLLFGSSVALALSVVACGGGDGEEAALGGSAATPVVTREPTTATSRLPTPPSSQPPVTPALTPSATAEPPPTPAPTADLSPTPQPSPGAAPDGPLPPGVLYECPPFPQGRSDAAVIATSILGRESEELLFDADKFANLSGELERVLVLIRGAYPATASIHARDIYMPGEIIVNVETPLKEAIESAIAARPDGAGLVTGQAAFDALNAQLGGVRALRMTHYYSMHSSVVLCLDQRVNVRPASLAYWDMDGTRYAEPNQLVGDGDDVSALRDGDTWYVLFRDAWGDCPIGCTGEQLMYFAVTGGAVVPLDIPQTASDARFTSLARWVRWNNETVGIGVYWAQNSVTGEFVIAAPLLDSPAYQAGVRPGDVILAFNGKPAGGWTEDDFTARLGGYEGTEVTLNVRHSDGSVEDISFVRAAVSYDLPAQAERIGVELLAGTATGVLLLHPTPNLLEDPASIRWGDLLLAIDGESTANWTATQVADRIDSIRGEHVTLTVRHIEGQVEDLFVRTRPEICPVTGSVPVFKGVVYLDGELAPAGSALTAEQGGVEIRVTAIIGDDGHYEYPVISHGPPCLPGGPVSFKMNGLIANEMVDPLPGPQELDLTFQSPQTATPTATAQATL